MPSRRRTDTFQRPVTATQSASEPVVIVAERPAIGQQASQHFATQTRLPRPVPVMLLSNAELALATSPPAVVIFAGNGESGIAFLNHARKSARGTARIAWLQRTDPALGARLSKVSHQVWTPDCSSERLTGVVRAAARIQRLRSLPELAEVFGDGLILPALPTAYGELSALLADEQASLRRVAEIIERDGALTAKLLQLVRSAFFGAPKNVQSVGGAVAYLGLHVLRGLVLSTAVFSVFKPRAPGFSTDQHQSIALRVAQLAKRGVRDRERGELAQLAGILHNTGDLMLAHGAPATYSRIAATARARGTLLATEQFATLGTSGAEVGAALLGLWGLPNDVVEAIADQHAPRDHGGVGGHDLAATLHCATRLLHNPDAEIAPATSHPEPTMCSTCAGHLGDQLAPLREQARELGRLPSGG